MKERMNELLCLVLLISAVLVLFLSVGAQHLVDACLASEDL